MALRTLDVDSFPTSTGCSADQSADLRSDAASVDVKAAVDARSVEAASARRDRRWRRVGPSPRCPDVASAVTAEAVLASEVGVVNADVVATANLGSAHLAEEALQAAVGTINAEVSVSASGAGRTGALASELDGDLVRTRGDVGNRRDRARHRRVCWRQKQAGDLLIGLCRQCLCRW